MTKETGRDFQRQTQEKRSREGVNPDMSRNPQDRWPESQGHFQMKRGPWSLLPSLCPLCGGHFSGSFASCRNCCRDLMCSTQYALSGTVPFPLQYEIPRELPIIIANPAGHSSWSNQWSHEPRLHQPEIFQVGVGGKHLFSLPGGISLSRYQPGATNCCVVAQPTPIPAPQLKE